TSHHGVVPRVEAAGHLLGREHLDVRGHRVVDRETERLGRETGLGKQMDHPPRRSPPGPPTAWPPPPGRPATPQGPLPPKDPPPPPTARPRGAFPRPRRASSFERRCPCGLAASAR